MRVSLLAGRFETSRGEICWGYGTNRHIADPLLARVAQSHFHARAQTMRAYSQAITVSG